MTRQRPPNRGRPRKTNPGATRFKFLINPGATRSKKFNPKRFLIKVRRLLKKFFMKYFNF